MTATTLTAAIACMVIAVCLGLWLSALHLIREEPPKKIPVVGLIHGAAGAAAVITLFFALQGPPRGVHTGAGGFGWTSFVLLAATLAGGITILTFHLRRRGAPVLLVAMHGMLGIAGSVMLSAWYASPSSFGR